MGKPKQSIVLIWLFFVTPFARAGPPFGRSFREGPSFAAYFGLQIILKGLKEISRMVKRNLKRIDIWFCLILTIALLFMAKGHTQIITPLRLMQTIPLPDVVGRIDHMAIDLKGQHLFVAALGNNSL